MFETARREKTDVGTRAHSPGAIIALGVISILGGVAVLVWPGITLVAIAVIFAIELLVLGVMRLVAAFSVPDAGGGARVLLVLLGVIAIIAGIVLVRHPFHTIALLALLIGAFWVVDGLIEVFDAVAARHLPGRSWAIAGGVLMIVAGVFVLAFTQASLIALVWLLGIQLIVYGLLTLVRGNELRRARHAVQPQPTMPGGAAGATGH